MSVFSTFTSNGRNISIDLSKVVFFAEEDNKTEIVFENDSVIQVEQSFGYVDSVFKDAFTPK